MRKQEGRINHVMSFGVSLDAINIRVFSHPFATQEEIQTASMDLVFLFFF